MSEPLIDSTLVAPGSQQFEQVFIASAFFIALEVLLRIPAAKRAIVAHLLKPGEKLDARQQEQVFEQAASRIVAEAFNIIALPLAYIVLRDPAMWEDRMHATSSTSKLLLMACSGYFIHDTFVCMSQVHHEGFMYVVHAVLCTLVYTYGLLSGTHHLFGAGFILWELSTPFVHVHWYMYRKGRTDEPLFLRNGLAMLLVFFLVRNCFGGVMSYNYFLASGAELARTDPGAVAPSVIWMYRFANVGLNVLNLFWVNKMFRGAMKAMKKAKGRGKSQ